MAMGSYNLKIKYDFWKFKLEILNQILDTLPVWNRAEIIRCGLILATYGIKLSNISVK